MNTEKVILSFVAVIIGLIIAGGAFYVYQTTRAISPTNIHPVALVNPSPTPSPAGYLIVNSPPDESVTDNRTLVISGKIIPNSTLVVSSATSDQVVAPTSMGDFSVTLTIGDGENKIYLESINPSGKEITKILTVTYSTESF